MGEAEAEDEKIDQNDTIEEILIEEKENCGDEIRSSVNKGKDENKKEGGSGIDEEM